MSTVVFYRPGQAACWESRGGSCPWKLIDLSGRLPGHHRCIIEGVRGLGSPQSRVREMPCAGVGRTGREHVCRVRARRSPVGFRHRREAQAPSGLLGRRGQSGLHSASYWSSRQSTHDLGTLSQGVFDAGAHKPDGGAPGWCGSGPVWHPFPPCAHLLLPPVPKLPPPSPSFYSPVLSP